MVYKSIYYYVIFLVVEPCREKGSREAFECVWLAMNERYCENLLRMGAWRLQRDVATWQRHFPKQNRNNTDALRGTAAMSQWFDWSVQLNIFVQSLWRYWSIARVLRANNSRFDPTVSASHPSPAHENRAPQTNRGDAAHRVRPRAEVFRWDADRHSDFRWR